MESSSGIVIKRPSGTIARPTESKQHQKYAHISQLYYNKSETIATFIDEQSTSKDNLLNIRENHGFGPFVEVKANY